MLFVTDVCFVCMCICRLYSLFGCVPVFVNVTYASNNMSLSPIDMRMANLTVHGSVTLLCCGYQYAHVSFTNLETIDIALHSVSAMDHGRSVISGMMSERFLNGCLQSSYNLLYESHKTDILLDC